jgi:hypothetical protein
MRKIRVLLTYLVYPLAMGTYFRKALEHNDRIDLRVAGTYTGSWIPWNYGMNLPEKYAIPPDYPLPITLQTNEYPYETLKVMMQGWVPDIVIQVDAGFHAKHKPTDGMVVTVGTDPHVLNDWYDVPRKYSDRFFCMQDVYKKDKDIYLPYAYSKYDCYPESDKFNSLSSTGFSPIEKDLDAAIIGLQYTHVPRVQLVEELRKRGLKVFAENGPVFDEARAIYNRAKIGLNWSTMDDLNCRAFELPAFKICPVMNYVPDAKNFFGADVHYLQFSTLNEAIEKVMWAMENPEGAQDIAEKAYQNVLPHTYDARVDQILADCGF